jgi:hypothetical protein
VSGIKTLPITEVSPPASTSPQRQTYHYVTGLDPQGDNWLALKAAPNINSSRLAKMSPDTLLIVVEQQGAWLRVRLRNGSEGWAASRYIACCRNVD